MSSSVSKYVIYILENSVDIKNAVFWDIMSCGSYLNLGFGRTYYLHHQGEKNRQQLQFLVTANVDPRSPILVTLIMEALRSSETSVLTRATRRNIPEDGILDSHGSENLKSYISVDTVYIFAIMDMIENIQFKP
jgi:hypothetical protein